MSLPKARSPRRLSTQTKRHDKQQATFPPSPFPASNQTRDELRASQYFTKLRKYIKVGGGGVSKTSKLARRGRKGGSILNRLGAPSRGHQHHNKVTRKSPESPPPEATQEQLHPAPLCPASPRLPSSLPRPSSSTYSFKLHKPSGRDPQRYWEPLFHLLNCNIPRWPPLSLHRASADLRSEPR